MKRFTWYPVGRIILLLSILFSLLVVFGCSKKEPKEIKFGSILPLSGDAAVWGQNTKEGIDLAVEEINKKGGIDGLAIRIIYEDSQAVPKQGVSAIQKLITVDKVPAVIDDSVSSVTLAMAPIAQQNHVVIVSVGATAPAISQAGEYIFRLWNSDAYEGEITAQYVYGEAGFSKICILYVNNDYGRGLMGVFRRDFEKKGGEVLITESFDQGAPDFRSQLAKVKQKPIQAIYLVGYPQDTPKLLIQAKEIGMNVPFFGTVIFNDPQLISVAGEAAIGIIFPFPKEPEGEAVKEFGEKFKEKYGKEAGATADTGYDAVFLIKASIELSGGYRGEDIQKGLMMIKDYRGVSGEIEFDENGDVHKAMGMKIVRDGKFVWLND